MSPRSRYPVPAGRARTEEVVRRSRFITTLAPAGSPEAARMFIDEVRAEHPDATHHCFAFLVGPPGSTAGVGLGDDGEPHGTAGRPMLNVLLHSGVGDVAVVVTRYFGGTKLGTGGLARAYSGGVQQALAAAVLTEKISWQRLRLVVDYPALDGVRRLCPELEAVIDAEDFSETVRLDVRLPEERVSGFRAMLQERYGSMVRIVT